MINIYILRNTNLTPSDVDTLPFGESEKKRIYALNSYARRQESIGGLKALAELMYKSNIPCPTISRAENGKPYFSTAPALPFGISHSHGFSAAALATADCGDIGFDIELVRAVRSEAIARRFFSPRELSLFENCGHTEEAFFLAWTEKEAVAKLDGNGIWHNHSNIAFDKNILFCHIEIKLGNDRLMMCTAHRAAKQEIKIFVDGKEIVGDKILLCT